ncbi:hypothetical protein K402DRAFT_393013 [Aulographum hederae CBS 113979]|uniref:Uncharacterized protein n=1 Tax=Aulographum hederae CBS 113979 TaxID=1176131 RepID=A0A6G1H274_9PEZI|nr:hypothetical protein K402DRAFT_393013 [Aulographum hederae CBS 113979]
MLATSGAGHPPPRPPGGDGRKPPQSRPIVPERRRCGRCQLMRYGRAIMMDNGALISGVEKAYIAG